jgi:hypothetical protein
MGVNQTVQFQAATDSSAGNLSLSRTGKGRGRSKSTIVSLAVSPQQTTVGVNATSRFSAVAVMSDGSTTEPKLIWTATGGTVDGTGLFTAGPTPGSFRVTAAAANGMADTAVVQVSTLAPVAKELTLSPISTTLVEGTSQQFSAIGKAGDGTTVGVAPVYKATGGSVTTAGLYTAGTTAGSYQIIALDTAAGLADTASVTVTDTASTPILQSISLSPATVTLTAGGTQQFAATGKMTDGTTGPVSVTLSATGGTISSAGLYTAGNVAGNYRLIATQVNGTLADTAGITISLPLPTLQSVVITPASATLSSGGTQQFAASGKMSDGSTTPINVTFDATGGTITSAGLYTAGSSSGAFRVIATQQGGTLADTASVTVSSPTPSSGSCARDVNVSTLNGLTSAVANAQPGDCISVAPGTYTLGTSLTFSRSGTSNQPIVIEGAGWSSTVVNVNLQDVSLAGVSYVTLRKLRFTNFSNIPLVYNGETHHTLLDSLEFDHAAQELIEIRGSSHDNTIQHSYFHDSGTGPHPEFGEAIYVGGTSQPGCSSCADLSVLRTRIIGNRFANITAQSIEIASGANGTYVAGNVIDGSGTLWQPSYGNAGLVSIISSYDTLVNNRLTYGSPRGFWFLAPTGYTMTGVYLSNNTVDLQNIHNVTFTPYAFDRTAGTTGANNVTVRCDNVVTNGAFSNVACTP